MKTWLLLDCNYMAYRSFYSTGGLTHQEVPTGVIYGFLRDVVSLCELHQTNRVVFCFDYGESLRKKLLPGYKASRHSRDTPEQAKAKEAMRYQLHQLRHRLLYWMGFQNVLAERGFEADDLIASVVRNSIPAGDEVLIVSADSDLYQLLGARVRLWNPHKGQAYTMQSLMKEYGVRPDQWAAVKAIAGCSSDEIPGVAGVGIKTAAKWIREELKADSAAAKHIEEAAELIKANMKLVRLPYAETPIVELEPDTFSEENWNSVLKQLGLKSLERLDLSILTGKKPRRKGLGLK